MPSPTQVDILLVDDDATNLLALETMLADLGQNLITARSGNEALFHLLARDFALILLDVQMPEMDGFEIARYIRGRDRSRATPIIFLTAHGPAGPQESRGYALGAVDFLYKPIHAEILRSKVAVFVELYQRTEEVRRQAELLRQAEQREHERRLAEQRQLWEAESLRLSNERLRLLSEIANRLLLEPEPEMLLEDVFQQLSAHLGLDVYVHYRVSEDGQTLRLASSGGVPEELRPMLERFAMGESMCGLVAVERRVIVAEDIQRSSEASTREARALGLAAHACFPLLAQGRLIGTLGFGTRERNAFGDAELATLQVIANQAAMAVDRARLIEELRRRAAALAMADRRKDEFLAMLAHELRNPLTPITNALHVLRRHPEGDIGIRTREAMARQLDHLTRLVDDLLDVSRITYGKIVLQRERVEVRGVIEQAVQACRPLIDERGHACVVTLPEGPVWVDADPTRLVQIFANLVNNAAKYTDRGGRIEVHCQAEGTETAIRVKDSGIGIRPEALGQVFELFAQLDGASGRSQGGLGLGLSLVRRLVELHDGTVSVHSEGLGRGSEFVVRLPRLMVLVTERTPAVEAAALGVPPDEDEDEAAPTDGRPLKLVLIEDNEDIRQTLGDLLRMAGHDVAVAGDGYAGVRLVLDQRPDVALIDIGLPGLDGYAVARQLRAQNCTARLIAMSGYGQAEDRRRSAEAGFDAHLVKPVRPDRLFRELQSYGTERAASEAAYAAGGPYRVSTETRGAYLGDER